VVWAPLVIFHMSKCYHSKHWTICMSHDPHARGMRKFLEILKGVTAFQIITLQRVWQDFHTEYRFSPHIYLLYGHCVIYFRILIRLQNCYIMANMKYYSISSRNQYRLVCRRYPGWISAVALTVLTDVFHSFLQLFQALPRWCLRLGHNFLPLHPFQLIIHA